MCLAPPVTASVGSIRHRTVLTRGRRTRAGLRRNLQDRFDAVVSRTGGTSQRLNLRHDVKTVAPNLVTCVASAPGPPLTSKPAVSTAGARAAIRTGCGHA
jgi:hypothetical protein